MLINHIFLTSNLLGANAATNPVSDFTSAPLPLECDLDLLLESPDEERDLVAPPEFDHDLLWLGLSWGGSNTEKARSTAETSANLETCIRNKNKKIMLPACPKKNPFALPCATLDITMKSSKF